MATDNSALADCRPEGAARLESLIEAWDREYGDDAIMTPPRIRELADFLAARHEALPADVRALLANQD